jgi:hypothetical protein
MRYGHIGIVTFSPQGLAFEAKSSLTMSEPRMRPSQMPFQPTVHHLHRNGRLLPPNYLHESWLDYLYWDTELEP